MDAVLSVDELIHTADRWGWRAVAITDLANIHASSDAMRCVRSRCRGIKVIFGMEGYLTEGDSKTSIPHNITILVKNKMGLHHLYELILYRIFNFIIICRTFQKVTCTIIEKVCFWDQQG